MSQNQTFPIKLKASAAAWQELHSCEYGSYEDHIQRDGHGGVTRVEPFNEIHDGQFRLHIVEILERQEFKTVVYLRNQREVDDFFGNAFSGTFGLVDPDSNNTGFQRTAQRLYDELAPHVSPGAYKPGRGGIGY